MVVGQPPAAHERDRLYADVIVPRHLAGPFTYIVPFRFQQRLHVGRRVLVPLGRSTVQGAVVSLANRPPQGLEAAKLREISDLLADDTSTDLSPPLFNLSKWVAEQYVAPWGQCLRLVLPPPVPKPKQTHRYLLTELGREALARHDSCSEEALLILNLLNTNPSGLPRSTIHRKRNREHRSAIQGLLTRGWIAEQESSRRGPSRPSAPDSSVTVRQKGVEHGHAQATNERQHAAPTKLSLALRQKGTGRTLLQAPWPDRSALLYQAVSETVGLGRTVLIIVGEAERAEEIARTIRERHTDFSTGCFHSGLPDQDRAEEWKQVDQQRRQVIVGTRSATFLPLRQIGLIWVEGEEDPALKEPQEPRYHAREVAWYRAQAEQALLVLSSGHPSLETQAAVESSGQVIRVPDSVETAPTISLVDLRGQGRENILTPPLVQALREAVTQRTGAMLFLNRKHYAGALVCRDCGQIPRCPVCSVAFTYSRQRKRLLCAYCGSTEELSDVCTACSGPRLHPIGRGTERVEEEARRLFPAATILRIDGETLRRPKQIQAFWRLVARREWDVLIGTQMLLRPALSRSMGLVGLVHADAGLSIPDFRAAERTYHQLRDAIDCARPATSGGQVIVQTYLPTHHTIQALVQQDESIFLSEERAQRAALSYPPLVHLIALHISGADERLVKQASASWAAKFTAMAGGSTGLTLLGPIPSPVPRQRGRYRWQILLKSVRREVGIEAARTTLRLMEQAARRRTVKFDVDVDPIDLW